MPAKRTTTKAPAAAGGNKPQTITTELSLPHYHQVYAWCTANADLCRRNRTSTLAAHITAQLGFTVSEAEVARIRKALGLVCYTDAERVQILEGQVAALTARLDKLENGEKLASEKRAAALTAMRRRSQAEPVPYPVPFTPHYVPSPAPFRDPSTRPMCRVIRDGFDNIYLTSAGSGGQ